MGITKKSQTEIIGLVVIVLLLSIGLLFVVLFFLRGGEEPPHKAFTQKQLPYNMIHSILETESGCRGTNMRELFIDCFVSESIRCNTVPSCEYLNDTLEYMFQETLDIWKIEYEFGIKPHNPRFPSFGYCSGEKRSGSQPLQTDAGTMYINLAICGDD